MRPSSPPDYKDLSYERGRVINVESFSDEKLVVFKREGSSTLERIRCDEAALDYAKKAAYGGYDVVLSKRMFYPEGEDVPYDVVVAVDTKEKFAEKMLAK